MGAENAEEWKKVKVKEKKERDSSPQESDAMSRYLDLRSAAYNPLMSAEERMEFAQNLIDLVKTLNKDKGISTEFREDILAQIKRIEEGHTNIKRVAEAVSRLERESRGGVQVPHLYTHVVELIKKTLHSGVPETALEPFRVPIQEYLREVRAQTQRR